MGVETQPIGDGRRLNMATFVDAAKSALEKIQQEAIPLRNRLEKLDKQREFLENVLTQAKELFPDLTTNLKVESLIAQYNNKTVLREYPPAKRMRRHSHTDLVRTIASLFEEADGPLHCKEIAEKLLAKGMYSSLQSALLSAEKYLRTETDKYAKVGPRTYQLRTGAALVGEIVAARGEERLTS